LGELKVEPVDKKLQYESNWLQHVRRVDNRMPKLMWKYRPKGRKKKKLGRPLNKAKSGLLRPNS